LLREREARQEAELAQSNEAKLRRQAEAREKITQVAILVAQGSFDEADAMISKSPPTGPSVESARVLRSLSEWHALDGRWMQAADRLNLLVQVNQMDGWDESALDFFSFGICLIESGRTGDYARFQKEALARFAPTTSGVAAERVLKIGILELPSPAAMQSFAPLARVAEQAFTNLVSQDKDTVLRTAWGSVSLALWEYRRGHYAAGIEWAKRCLACPYSNAPREATARVELAMDLYQNGRKDEALRELGQVRRTIQDKFKNPLEAGNGTEGFWFDWVFARELLREANGLIDPPPSVTP
jgi:hypothetical protein